MATVSTSASITPLYLFGASKPWNTTAWTTTDDRVRGGSSQSHLTALPSNRARFHGTLDTSTLGGAGFASQFSPLDAANNASEPDALGWDLSTYDGIEVCYADGDGKEYTLILKDALPDTTRDDGREKSGVNWEVDFMAEEGEGGRVVWFPWSEFRATYRGRPKDDTEALKTGGIRRVGVMMRSQFGKQEGEFSVQLKYLCARKESEEGVKAEL